MLAAHGRLHYCRHFALLACCAAGILLLPWRLWPGVAAWFAAYGALHATALVASLRERQSRWRLLLFVVIAALLGWSLARLGLYGLRFMGELPAAAGAAAVLGMASSLGALAYGGLIRRFRFLDLPFGALAATASGCMLTTLMVAGLVGRSPVRGAVWVTIAWWFAFSTALWYRQLRRNC